MLDQEVYVVTVPVAPANIDVAEILRMTERGENIVAIPTHDGNLREVWQVEHVDGNDLLIVSMDGIKRCRIPRTYCQEVQLPRKNPPVCECPSFACNAPLGINWPTHAEYTKLGTLVSDQCKTALPEDWGQPKIAVGRILVYQPLLVVR